MTDVRVSSRIGQRRRSWSRVALLVIAFSSAVVAAVSSTSSPARAVDAPAPFVSAGSDVRCVKVDPDQPTVVPTPGFNPLVAPDAELQAQSFPPRPTNPGDLAVWQSYARAYLAGTVTNCATPTASDIPPELQSIQQSADGYTPNWAGYLVHDATFSDAQINSYANAVTGGTSDQVSAWAGVNLGSGNGHQLVQAGAIMQATNPNESELFTEIWGYNANGVFQDVKTPVAYGKIAGTLYYAHATFGNNGYAYFHLVDVSAKVAYQPPGYYTNSTLDGHAEVLIESPCVPAGCSSGYLNLANFGVWSFSLVQAYSPTTGWQDFAHLDNIEDFMYRSADNHTLAVPSALNPDGTFNVTWENPS